MSFTRADYERTFDFALTVRRLQEHLGARLGKEAVAIMDLCEGTIGQISHRPEESRKQESKRRRRK